ncbi:integrase core domain-containing protein [Acidithiobacillus sp.]
MKNFRIMASWRACVKGDGQSPAPSARCRKKSSGCNKEIFAGGKGRALDNIFVERLWRTVKYERVYLNPADSGTQLKVSLKEYFHWCNGHRPHSSLNDRTPDAVYFDYFKEQAA